MENKCEAFTRRVRRAPLCERVQSGLPSEENDVQTQLSSGNKNLHLQLMAQSKERVSKRL